MRDLSLNPNSFVIQLEKVILGSLGDKFNILRNHVVDNPNFLEGSYQLRIPRLKLKQFISLAIVHWYMPEEIQYLVHLDLKEKSRFFSLEDQTLISQFLISKQRTILFLLETQLFHTRDFFGNILGKDCIKLINRISFRKSFWFVKRPQRKRGYHDHGSRVLEHIFKETRYISRTKEMKELEQQRQTFQDTLALLEGMLI